MSKKLRNKNRREEKKLLRKEISKDFLKFVFIVICIYI